MVRTHARDHLEQQVADSDLLAIDDKRFGLLLLDDVEVSGQPQLLALRCSGEFLHQVSDEDLRLGRVDPGGGEPGEAAGTS